MLLLLMLVLMLVVTVIMMLMMLMMLTMMLMMMVRILMVVFGVVVVDETEDVDSFGHWADVTLRSTRYATSNRFTSRNMTRRDYDAILGSGTIRQAYPPREQRSLRGAIG